MDSTPDLSAVSESFDDMVRSYAGAIKAGVGAVLKDRLEDVTGLGDVPGDVTDPVLEDLSRWLEFYAATYAPGLTAKAEAELARASAGFDRAVAQGLERLGTRAVKLIKAAESTGVEPRTSKLRLVSEDITYAQVLYGKWWWSGTVLEARLMRSAYVVTPARPGDSFVIYAPGNTLPPKTSGVLKVIQSTFR